MPRRKRADAGRPRQNKATLEATADNCANSGAASVASGRPAVFPTAMNTSATLSEDEQMLRRTRRFVPVSVSAAHWEAVRPFFLGVMERSGLVEPAANRTRLALARFLLWLYTDGRQVNDVDQVLTPVLVEDYARHRAKVKTPPPGQRGRRESTKHRSVRGPNDPAGKHQDRSSQAADDRSRLRTLGRQLCTPGVWLDPVEIPQVNRVAPHTDAEWATHHRQASTLPPAWRYEAWAMLDLAFHGCTPGAVKAARGTWVTPAPWGALVTVPEQYVDGQSIFPVVGSAASRLLDLAATRGDEPLIRPALASRKSAGHHIQQRMREFIPGWELDLRRASASMLLAASHTTTTPAVMAAAFGLRPNSSRFHALVPYMDPPGEDVITDFLVRVAQGRAVP